MSPRAFRRFKRIRSGGVGLNLSREERVLLSSLPEEVEILLNGMAEGGEVPNDLRRLFPPAYLSDEKAESAYRDLLGGSLAEEHRNSLRVLRETSEKVHLDEDEAYSWLLAMNDLRLVLGSRLQVTEEQLDIEPDDPSYGPWICYQYLSFLQSELIEALSAGLPDGHDDGETIKDPWGEPPGGLRWDGTPLPPG